MIPSSGAKVLSSAAIFFSFLLAGCDRIAKQSHPSESSPNPASQTTPAAASRPETPGSSSQAEMERLAALPDEALTKANEKDGLGLGLKVSRRTLHQGEPFPLHILLEEFNAGAPIAADLCIGLQMNLEDLITHGVTSSDIHSITCNDPSRFFVYRQPLKRGQIVALDVLQHNQFDAPIPPGDYIMTVTWQAFPTAQKADLLPVPYSSLTSNPIPITVSQ